MANTYTKIYIQIIFGVKYRKALINLSWEVEQYKYITGIVENSGQKMIAINGVPDHIHFLIGMKPTCCLSRLCAEIKKSTSTYIKTKRYTQHKFEWQPGFGAFSYSESSLDNVVAYIKRQKEHHLKRSFHNEYLQILKMFNVDFNPKYLFTDLHV